MALPRENMLMRVKQMHSTDWPLVQAAGHLFDRPPRQHATEHFLAQSNHHLLIAYEEDCPAGFVSGVEMTHPDKGTEMFLYELAVDARYRGHSIGKALVIELVTPCPPLQVLWHVGADG